VLAFFVAPPVPGDDRSVDDDLDLVDVSLDRARLEGEAARDAVAVVVECGRLILVDFAIFANAGVERTFGQRYGQLTFLLEAAADRFTLTGDDAIAINLAAMAKMIVQLVHVLHLRHGRGPTSLKVFDAILGMRLLVTPGGHAEQRLEVVVARQGHVTRIDLPLPTAQHGRGDRRRVIPPDFLGHTTKEIEGRLHAVKNRLDPFAGQGDGEGSV